MRRVIDAGCDVSRHVLEALELEEPRSGRITEPELAQALVTGHLQLDGCLKAHEIRQAYTLEDFEAERRAVKERGLLIDAIVRIIGRFPSSLPRVVPAANSKSDENHGEVTPKSYETAYHSLTGGNYGPA